MSNLEAYQAGVQPLPDATPEDYNGDGVANDEDAVPDDPLIRWAPTFATRYILLDLGTGVDGWYPQGLSECGAVIFSEGVWVAGQATPHTFPVTSGSVTSHDPEVSPTYQAQGSFGFAISPDGRTILANAWASVDEEWTDFFQGQSFGWSTISVFGTHGALPWDPSGNHGFGPGDSPGFMPLDLSSERVFSIREDLNFDGDPPATIEVHSFSGGHLTSLPSPPDYEPAATHDRCHSDVTPSGWVASNLKRGDGTPGWRLELWNPDGEFAVLPAAADGWKWTVHLTEMPGDTAAVAAGAGAPGYLSGVFVQDKHGQFLTSGHFAGTSVRALAGNGTALGRDMKLWANGGWLEPSDWCPEIENLIAEGWNLDPVDADGNGRYLLVQYDAGQAEITTKIRCDSQAPANPMRVWHEVRSLKGPTRAGVEHRGTDRIRIGFAQRARRVDKRSHYPGGVKRASSLQGMKCRVDLKGVVVTDSGIEEADSRWYVVSELGGYWWFIAHASVDQQAGACVPVEWKDFGPPPTPSDPPIRNRHPLENFMLRPKYSFFYSLFKPTTLEAERDKPLYDVHLNWAEGLEKLSKAKEEEKDVLLERSVKGENPLLEMHAVHLIARFYPQKARKKFKDWVILQSVLPEVRLTIDYELTIMDRKTWLDSDVRSKWVAMLEKENPIAMEGTNLVDFHKRVLPMWLSED